MEYDQADAHKPEGYMWLDTALCLFEGRDVSLCRDLQGGLKMDKVILSSENVAKPFGIFSQGVKVGNLVFVSGQISKNTKGEVVGKGDIRAQTRQCIENLKQVLEAGEAGGATLENVVKVTVYVTDMEHLKAIHEVRAQYFKEKYPASTLVEVSRLTTQDCMIEIEAIAII